MITLHESDITSFPLDNGIGVLRDAIQAYAEEELNGLFEFYMEYDSEGHLVDELKEERIIKAKAQDKLGYQLFRIYSITKNHENDNLIVQAQHITYDLANNFVETLEARNLTKKQVMEKIGSSTAYPHPFNMTSSNTTTQSSTSLYRTNPLQMVGGMEGSVLQIWGGQIERDNFNLILHDRRGSDDGVKVTYEKNITGLEATFDISGLVTRIFPFVYIEATDDEPERLITVSGKYIDSPHINDYEKIYIEPIDYSSDDRINTDGTDAQIRQQLTSIASQYFTETGNDKIKVEMDVKFEHLWETEEYKDLAVLELVGLGDTVTIEHSRLKVDATAIVNYIRYDCIAEKNEEVRLGSVKARLTDNVNKVVDVAEKAERAEQTANQAIRAANGKNTIYYGPDEPEGGIEGDLWFRVVDGEYTRTYRHDGIQWQLVLSVDVRDAIDEAQQAKDEAQQAVDRANQATQQANNAINQAQTAFDEAQQALSTASNAYDIATTLQGDVTNLSTLVDEHTGQISSITQSVTGLQTQVSDIDGNVSTLTQTVSNLTTRVGDAEGNITALQQTSVSLAGRLSDAEGNITTLTATVNGLQTTVSNVQGDVSSVTQLANALQTRMTNAEGDISTLTQTASSLQSTVSSLQTELDELEIGGRNLAKGTSDEFQQVTMDNWNHYHDGTTRYDAEVIPGEYYTASVYYRNVQNIDMTIRIFWTLSDGSIAESSNGSYVRVGEEGYATITARAPNNAVGAKVVIRRNAGSGGGISSCEYKELMLVKGNRATDWTPAPEDMATQSQITQLSDAINLRVEKGDVINQINISDESILIDGRRVHITGQTTIDNGVIKSAHIQSLDAGKITTGTLDAGRISVMNLSANSIVGGVLQSNNSNVTFNLNTSRLEIASGGTFIFTDPNNGIRYSTGSRSSGIVLSHSLGYNSPMVAIGVDHTTGVIDANSANFSGLRIHARGTDLDNNMISRRFIFTERADMTGGGFVIQSYYDGENARSFHPWNADNPAFVYDLGRPYARWRRVYLNYIYGADEIRFLNIYDNSDAGWVMKLAYAGDPTIDFYPQYTGSYYYNIGRSNNRINRFYVNIIDGNYLGTSSRPFDVVYARSVVEGSDRKLKSNITLNRLGLDFINDLETVEYTLNGDGRKNGLIAQDVQAVLEKHGVNFANQSIVVDGEYMGISYTQLIAPLIKSVQELDKKTSDNIEWLKIENQYLKQKVKQLEELIT